MTKLQPAERETIARFSDDTSEPMTFETFNKRHALRLINSGATVLRTSNRGGCTYWTLQFPREWFRWPRAKSEVKSRVSRENYQNRILRSQGPVFVASQDASVVGTGQEPSETSCAPETEVQDSPDEF